MRKESIGSFWKLFSFLDVVSVLLLSFTIILFCRLTTMNEDRDDANLS